MTSQVNEYVTLIPPGQWRIGATRVSFDSVVHAYWSGRSPEATVEDFPTLNVEQVKGALAWYFENRAEVDEGLQEREREWEQFRQECTVKNAPLIQKIRQRASITNQLTN
ncbi:hypothetical protein BH11PLA2_BH11PLA2_14840 [soil metagenome]